MTAEEIASVPDEEITFQFLREKGAKAKHINPVGILPIDLKKRGADSAIDLLDLEYDSLHLADPAFLASMISAFGTEDVTNAFLRSPLDSLALASVETMSLLQIGPSTLLAACAGAPEQAAALLRILPSHRALENVSAETILDTGLRAKSLLELGFNNKAILAATGATMSQMKKLGF